MADRLLVPPTYISGLQLEWVTATALRARPGVAFVQSYQNLADVQAAIDKSGLAFAANTRYYVYLYHNGTAWDLDISTTAPVVYRGTACIKGADTSRRYLGMVLGNPAGTGMMKFEHHGSDWVSYKENILAPPLEVATDQRPAINTDTNISFAGVAPVTCRRVECAVYSWQVSGSVYVTFGTSDDNISLVSGSWDGSGVALEMIYPGGNMWDMGRHMLDVDASQVATFRINVTAGTSGNGYYFHCRGYQERR